MAKARKRTKRPVEDDSRPGFPWPILLGLIALSLGLFWRATGFDFVVVDDPVYVYENPEILQGLSARGIVWAFSGFFASTYIPITWLSLMIDSSLQGTAAGGFHLTNILLHALNVGLLFLLMRRLSGSVWRSALVAALFAVHPLRVESVAWIVERKDVLSTGFCFFGLWLYAGAVKSGGARRLAPVALCMALGLLAKPMVITMPFLLLLLDLWPLRRVTVGGEWSIAAWVPLLREKLMLLALAGLFIVVTLLSHRASGGPAVEHAVSLGTRVGRSLVAYPFYLGKILWPAGLSVIYPPFPRLGITAVAASLLLLLGITGATLRGLRARPYLAVGWLWFAGSLIPVIGLLRVGIAQVADRFTYLPFVGLAVVLAWSLGELAERRPTLRGISIGVGLALVLGCALRTHLHLPVWRDSEALFEHSVEVTQRNGLSHAYLGGFLAKAGRGDEALPHLEKAVQWSPESAMAHAHLSAVLLAQGRVEEAVREGESAVAADRRLSSARVNLGNALLTAGDFPQAAQAYHAALEISPNQWQPHYNLGNLWARQGQWARALRHYQSALERSPGNARVLERLREAHERVEAQKP